MLAFYDLIEHNQTMTRRTDRKILDDWIERNGPDGVTVLAYKSKVSASTIQKARASEKAPKKLSTLQRISETIGAEVDDLFPKEKPKGKAS
jgi:hypothetical protein